MARIGNTITSSRKFLHYGSEPPCVSMRAVRFGESACLSVEAIAARIVHLLRKDGRMPYFAPVSAMPGFSKALTNTLTELRLQGVNFRELLAAGDPGKDLSALLALYEQKLDEASLADLP